MLYTYLAEVDGDISSDHIGEVLEHLSSDAWVSVCQKMHNNYKINGYKGYVEVG